MSSSDASRTLDVIPTTGGIATVSGGAGANWENVDHSNVAAPPRFYDGPCPSVDLSTTSHDPFHDPDLVRKPAFGKPVTSLLTHT